MRDAPCPFWPSASAATSAFATRSALFSAGERYLEKVSVDGKLVTGQNPWSVWKMAEAMVTQLGYPLQAREITAEENSIEILSVYEKDGFKLARQHMQALLEEPGKSVDKVLIAMHSIVALMDWEFIKIVDLLRLLGHASGSELKVSSQQVDDNYHYPIVNSASKQIGYSAYLSAIRKHLFVQGTV